MADPLTFPVVGVAAIGITKNPVGGMNQSPYTGKQEVIGFPGQWWVLSVTMKTLSPRESGKVEAFLGLLNGVEGTFLIGDPMRPVPYGAAAESPGVPILDGDHVVRTNTLLIKGAAPSVTGWLLQGDYIQLGIGADTRLHQVLQDVDTDADGKAMLTVWPRLRSDYAGEFPVIVSGCVGQFRMKQTAQQITRTPGPKTAYSFEAMEAL